MQLTPTFRSLLLRFRSVFTAPTFATFLHIATGWCLSHRHRYVTELIQSAGAVHRGHHSRYHRFFGNAAWSIDDLYEALAREAVATFCPEGTIELGVDDTLCRKRGLTIFGTGMHHDPLISSRKRVHVSWGHDWVILSLLVPNPPWSPTKVWALPVGMRLYRNRQGLTKGKKGQAKAKASREEAAARPEPPHPPRTGRGADPPVRGAVPAAEDRRQRRQCLRRQERPAAPARERRPDQPGRLQRGAVRAGAAAAAEAEGAVAQEGGPAAGHGRMGGRRRRPGRSWSSTSTACTRRSRSRRSGRCTTRRARTGC